MQDPVHEFLIDQANLRGIGGAVSARSDLGELDPDLALEEIVVGLLQPHAPAEVRVVKLVVRILQSGRCDPARLVFFAKRELALAALRWVVSLVPEPERNDAIRNVEAALERTPPRGERTPRLNYSTDRLVRRPFRA